MNVIFFIYFCKLKNRPYGLKQVANIYIFDKYRSVLDIILLLFLIPALISGLKKGLIAQIVAIVSLILGVWMSFKFASALSQWASTWIELDMKVLNIISFLVIFVLVAAGFGLLEKILEGVLKIVMLEWLNKLLGVLFAILKWGLVLGLVVMFFDSLNSHLNIVPQEKLDESVLYNPLKELADLIFPYLKALILGDAPEAGNAGTAV